MKLDEAISRETEARERRKRAEERNLDIEWYRDWLLLSAGYKQQIGGLELDDYVQQTEEDWAFLSEEVRAEGRRQTEAIWGREMEVRKRREQADARKPLPSSTLGKGTGRRLGLALFFFWLLVTVLYGLSFDDSFREGFYRKLFQ